MGEDSNQVRRRFRFSLKLLLVTFTIAAASLYLGLMIGNSLRPVGGGYSPDKVEFWLSWFYRGDASQRRAAAHQLSWRVDMMRSDQRLIDALCTAAKDDDREIRLAAARGLAFTAKTDQESRGLLRHLAEEDQDTDVRQRAQQSLVDAGIPAK